MGAGDRKAFTAPILPKSGRGARANPWYFKAIEWHLPTTTELGLNLSNTIKFKL